MASVSLALLALSASPTVLRVISRQQYTRTAVSVLLSDYLVLSGLPGIRIDGIQGSSLVLFTPLKSAGFSGTTLALSIADFLQPEIVRRHIAESEIRFEANGINLSEDEAKDCVVFLTMLESRSGVIELAEREAA